MYSKKRVGPRMEPWGTQVLTGYSCKDFPSRTTQSRPLLRNNEISPINRPEILQDSSFSKRPACQTLVKAFNISCTTTTVVPDLSKLLAILSDMTIKRSAVDRENLNPYWKSGKCLHYSRLLIKLLFLCFWKILLTT